MTNTEIKKHIQNLFEYIGFKVTKNHIDILVTSYEDGRFDFSTLGSYFFALATETTYRKVLLMNVELALVDYEYECLNITSNDSNEKEIEKSLNIAIEKLQYLVNHLNNWYS
jgi:hypothetical protein